MTRFLRPIRGEIEESTVFHGLRSSPARLARRRGYIPSPCWGDKKVRYTFTVKRWALRILLCLILGAITTVAVPWAIGSLRVWESADGYYERDETQGGETIRSSLTGMAGDGNGVRLVYSARGPFWSVANVCDIDISTDESRRRPDFISNSPPAVHDYSISWNNYDSYAFGWPALALRGSVLYASRIEQSEYWSEPKNMTVLDWRRGQLGRSIWSRPVRFLPFDPIWPGFVIDTLFYGAIWFGVFFGFSSAKRFLRIKRGRCPRCGYDLRGQRLVISDQRLVEGSILKPQDSRLKTSPGCPECGWGRADEEAHGD